MLGREAAERATKSREVFVRQVLNKQDEELFRKSSPGYASFLLCSKIKVLSVRLASKAQIYKFKHKNTFRSYSASSSLKWTKVTTFLQN